MSAAASGIEQSTGASPLSSLQLLDSFRKNDTQSIQSILSRLDLTHPLIQLESPLHLAVLCADPSVIEDIMHSRQLNANAQAADTGNTPLHLAVETNRLDVASFLMAQPDVNETVLNKEGKSPIQLVKSIEMAELFEHHSSELRHKVLCQLEAYEAKAASSGAGSPEEQALLETVSSPQIRPMHLEVMSTKSSLNVLQAAVKYKSKDLIKACVGKGFDPYVKDSYGRSANDMTTDKTMQAFLRQLAHAEAASLIDSHQPPSYRGFLDKWTNYMHGFKMRWFVLSDGVLSYYRTPDDEGKQARGSIILNQITIVPDRHDRNRFEIVNSSSKDSTRWYLRSRDSSECMRWIQILDKAQRLTAQGTATADAAQPALETPATAEADSVPQNVTLPEVPADLMDDAATETGSVDESGEGLHHIPHARSYAKLNNHMTVSFDVSTRLLSQLEEELSVPSQGVVMPPGQQGPQTASTTEPAFSKSSVALALRRSLDYQSQLWQQYVKMALERETFLREEVERLERTRLLWEEQVTVLARQHNELESHLHELVSENSQMRQGMRQTSQSQTVSEEPASTHAESGSKASNAVSAAAGAALGAASSVFSRAPEKQNTNASSLDDDEEFFDSVESDHASNREAHPSGEKSQAPTSGTDVPQEHQDKEKKQDSEQKPEHAPEITPGAKRLYALPEYEPYNHLRDRLPVRNDERPSISLWSILKNNIGKDLTKISFPVAFNEPTSMLQRMSEDLEFSECLDAAALQSDSTRRIMFVAAFAMSNYSSTIGRIAKPFNPMLGETFEYVRPDRGYRYISEQVSHHPPISACFCESPGWEYMGCVDAKSKFLGRTFEIRPTGVAHAKLKIKPEWAPESKRNTLPHAAENESLLMEHYSWNKVTTSVSGFITGSPTIDHYGDMTVVNHVTGDVCKLTFKPRGWRSTNAFEIRGEVLDAHGNKVWLITGRWNSQLIAKRSSGGEPSDLNPDEKDVCANPTDGGVSESKYLLLWRNSPKVPMPFNLTPFAVTLNSRPEGLMEWLPPTDCRRRPDLTAFENGKFDQADQLKVQLEELQRSKRRMREEGKLPPHKPRWFSKTTDPDTKEAFWKPHMSADEEGLETMDYWIERSKIGTKHVQNQDADWDTDHIFGDLEGKSEEK